MEKLNAIFEELEAMQWYFRNELNKFSIGVNAQNETLKSFRHKEETATVTLWN